MNCIVVNFTRGQVIFFFFFSMVSKKKESNVFFFVDVQRTYSNKMLRIDLERNSFSRTKKINKIMFVVVPIMNSEPFIKVGHRIRYPNFLIFQRAVNSIMNCYMNSTVVLRIQLHIVMYLGYTRIRFYQNWPRD